MTAVVAFGGTMWIADWILRRRLRLKSKDPNFDTVGCSTFVLGFIGGLAGAAYGIHDWITGSLK